MLKYKELYLQHLNAKGVNYTEPREDVVKVVYNSNNLSSIAVLAFFDQDGDNIVQFKCFNIIKMEEKITEAIIACNDINSKYRWVKFFIDEDNDIICESDSYIEKKIAARYVSV